MDLYEISIIVGILEYTNSYFLCTNAFLVAKNTVHSMSEEIAALFLFVIDTKFSIAYSARLSGITGPGIRLR